MYGMKGFTRNCRTLLLAVVFAVEAGCLVGCGGEDNPSGGSGGGSSGGSVGTAAVGKLQIINNSGYALRDGMISQNGKLVVNVGSMKKDDSWTYKDIPVGTCKVYFARTMESNYYKWETSVAVTEGNKSSVSVPKSGWTLSR